MFLGEYFYSVDEKGRVALPPKFRANLKSGAIITRGLDECLFVFGSKEWEKLAEKLIALPLAQANSRAFVRLMLAGAMDVKFDLQGRILIPDFLKKYSGLTKEASVIGLYNRIEIWSKEKWESYKLKTEKSSGEVAEKMRELGI